MGRITVFLSALVPLLMGYDRTAQASVLIPEDSKVVEKTGQALRPNLPSRFNFLVWNIHKAKQGETWKQDFLRLASHHDIIVIQEAYQIDIYQSAIAGIRDKLWNLAISFIYRGLPTGVATGSEAQPLKTTWLRSPGREPLIESPKMALLSEFSFSSNDTPLTESPSTDEHLLVANAHGLNFVTNNTFFSHISQIIKGLKNHRGPLILAGDFNTWNQARLQFLIEQCQGLGLSQVQFQDDPRHRPLDHIFYRDLEYSKSAVLSQIQTSDHLPLEIEFSRVRSSVSLQN